MRWPLATDGIAVFSGDLADGGGFELHDHPTHQLAWASAGVLRLAVADRTWVLPRSRALWIPARVPHEVRVAGDTTMRSLYFDPKGCPVAFDAPTVVDTTGLLGHLIDHLAEPLDESSRRRAEAVVFDLLHPLEVATLHVPMPTDDRARRVADALVADPADDRTLQQWGRYAHVSGRTLARLLEAETGLGFAAWRMQIRVAAALPRLAAGAPVGRVAQEVGYRTPSAFVAAFKRTVGSSPGRYVAG